MRPVLPLPREVLCTTIRQLTAAMLSLLSAIIRFSLPDAKSMSGDRKLTGDGKEITGWYYDGYKENGWTTRWSEEKDGAAYYDKYDAETGTANYALKAAHGLMCTVTYTDGVENEEIFADKVCVVEQDSATPAFDGNPTRSGYTFMGWFPAVTETVTADVTYTAQWTFTVPLPPRPPLRFLMTMPSV